MNWFAQQRQLWIAEMLGIYGFINREHIVKKFGVSVPSASSDLTLFRKNNPELVYDLSARQYRRSNGFEQDKHDSSQ